MDVSWSISEWAARDPRRAAVRFEGQELDHLALERQVASLAGVLRAAGVAAGDRVAYLGPSCPELLEALFACARLQAVFVPLNARMPAAELRVFLDQAEPRLLLAEEHFAATARESAAVHAIEVLPFAIGARWDGVPVPARRDADPTSPALIFFTSGTTGTPKGAVLTHEALLAHASATADVLRITPDDDVLTFTPMFHVAGLNLLTVPALSVGASVTVLRQFEPAPVLSEIAQGRVTLLLAPPHVGLELTADPGWPTTDLSRLRGVITGGTTVPRRALACWASRGVPVVQSYGLTEAAGSVSLLPLEESAAHSATAGRPMPHVELRVVDPVGRTARPGERGEVVVRGRSVMREYWRNPTATAEALHDGWLRTGDLGFLDGDGLLHVVDRLKEVIVVGVSNVLPADLEAVLAQSPEVAAVAVVGRPDEALGEVPVAFVVPAEGAELSREKVLGLFYGRLAAYKQPRDVVFLDAMPVTSVGKPEKKALRAMAARPA